MKKATIVIGLTALGLAGCSMAPRYTRPASPVPDTWPTDSTAATAAAPVHAADLGWREVFTEPRLQALIALALENNRDLRVAVLNVEKARALYNIQKVVWLPQVDGQASTSRSRTPADLSSSGQITYGESYRVGLGITAYEVDLFGRVASLKDAYLQTYQATEEARRSAQLSVVASVVQQYYAERATEEQLTLARQTLTSLETSFEATRRSYEAGAASELDLRTAEAQLASVRASLATYEQSAAQAHHALAVLIGSKLPDTLPAPLALVDAPLNDDLPAGLPSDLLQRRPDLLGAEHTLQSANANIGAARAAFFPKITLTAFGGSSSAALDGLFESSAKTWSFSPQLSVPIFAAGRNKANLDVAWTEQRIEVAHYEKAIQVAFQEVSDALATRTSVRGQVAAQRARVEAETARHRLSDLRYRGGVDSYLVLLTAQRDLFTAQQSLIQSEYARLANVAALYKALGGGWNEQRAVSVTPVRAD